MGLKSIIGRLLKFIFRRIFEIIIIGLLLVIIPNLPPNAHFSQPLSLAPTKPFEGKLALNNLLDDVEIWHKGDFLGPEAFADLNGELYTSLHLGDVVKLTGEHITPVVKFGKPCKGVYQERLCGRPLGLAFEKDNSLLAIDAYYGLFRVNVATGKKEQLVSPNTKIAGKKPKLFNSVAVASNGDIFWTDSSTDFLLEDGIYTMFADPSGRLIHYDAKTKKNRVLIDKLFFANGVALSDDEEFVIVAETGLNRIHRYWLKGAKKGTRDIFIDGLPGLPDNLKSDGKGGFLVPLVLSRDEAHPTIFEAVAPFPLLRKAITRFIGLGELIFKKIDEYYPNDVCEKVVHTIGHFGSIPSFLKHDRTTLLRINKKGEITHSAHTFDKKISGISEMHVFRDTLYLGSPFNDYIAKIPLAKLGWEDLKVDRVKRTVPIEEPKRTSTTSKPTTTTPRTTTTTTTPRPTTTTTTPRPTTTTTTPRPTTTTTTPRPTTTTTTPRPTTTTTTPRTTTTTTTPRPTTTTTTTSRPTTTTTTPRPTTTTTTARPTTTTQRPTTTTTQRPTTTTSTTPKPTTTTEKPTTTEKTTPKPQTTSRPTATSNQVPPPEQKQATPAKEQKPKPASNEVPNKK